MAFSIPLVGFGQLLLSKSPPPQKKKNLQSQTNCRFHGLIANLFQVFSLIGKEVRAALHYPNAWNRLYSIK